MIDPVERVLGLLRGVRQSGKDSWMSLCPVAAHADKEPSLSIARGRDGRCLLHCHAGCAPEAIVAAIGLTLADLMSPTPGQPAAQAPRRKVEQADHPAEGQIVQTYDYRDASGARVFQVCRYEPKAFRQRRPDGNGGWLWNLTGVPRVLYRLPELLAADPAGWCFIVEGEKDADALAALGLTGTTNPGGAGKWGRLADDSALHGRRAAIVPDLDEAGRRHAEDVARRLYGKAAAVRVLDLGAVEGFAEHGRKDITDWCKWLDSRTEEELAAALVSMANAAPDWTPAEAEEPRIRPAFISMRELLAAHPTLRPPVIHGLLRQGETMNVIGPTKRGKSWLVVDLALSIASGRPWLDLYTVETGNVLILDNELHSETLANRIPRVAEARGIRLAEVMDRVYVENLRGKLLDVYDLRPYFEPIEPGRFKIIILDAFYRFLPSGSDENDNSLLARLYNVLDNLAGRMSCCFIAIHHTSKGSQSTKAVTDVGAGAGSQSRAADTHLVLRPHEQDNAVVLDAAVRSWPPIAAQCLTWAFPVWTPDPTLDPTALRPERPRRKPKKDAQAETKTPKPEWDASKFVEACVTEEGQVKEVLVDAAAKQGLSKARAKALLRLAEADGKVHRWVSGANRPVRFATVPQPLIESGNSAKEGP